MLQFSVCASFRIVREFVYFVVRQQFQWIFLWPDLQHLQDRLELNTRIEYIKEKHEMIIIRMILDFTQRTMFLLWSFNCLSLLLLLLSQWCHVIHQLLSTTDVNTIWLNRRLSLSIRTSDEFQSPCFMALNASINTISNTSANWMLKNKFTACKKVRISSKIKSVAKIERNNLVHPINGTIFRC